MTVFSEQEDSVKPASTTDLPPTSHLIADAPPNEAVLDYLREAGNKKSSWTNTLVTLSLSAFAFMAIGVWQWRESLWLLLPVLAFHELGHLAAMRLFGYRNLKMFFIPFFGAAVTGQNENVAGWKKAIVALAGPLPGIALAIPLGIVGIATEQAWVMQGALMLLIVNGFNLLPFLPLDGGWVLHAVLFSRHPLLDVGFRVVATACLAGLGFAAGDWVLMFVALPLAISIPSVYRTARIAQGIRQEHPEAREFRGRIEDAPIIQTVVGRVRAVFGSGITTKLTADISRNVYELVSLRPPSLLASIGLLLLHGGAILTTIVFALLFVVAKQRAKGDTDDIAIRQREHAIACGGSTTQGPSWRSRLLTTVHGREHFVDHRDGSRADEDHENAGKDEEHEREDELHSRLGRLLFRNLPTTSAHRIALHAECLGDARAELVGLNEDGGEGSQVVDTTTGAKFLQSMGAATADLHLQVTEAEFFGNVAIGLPHFFGNFAHGLVETETCLDADYHQVEGIWETEKDRFLALHRHVHHNEFRQIERKTGDHDDAEEGSLGEAHEEDRGSATEHQTKDQQQKLRSLEDHRGRFAAQTCVRKLGLELADLQFGLRLQWLGQSGGSCFEHARHGVGFFPRHILARSFASVGVFDDVQSLIGARTAAREELHGQPRHRRDQSEDGDLNHHWVQGDALSEKRSGHGSCYCVDRLST
jgi:Zn-dependent protease